MEPIQIILTAISTAAGVASGAVTVGPWLVAYLREVNRNRRASEVLQWLHNLGSLCETDVRRLVADWQPRVPVAPAVRAELVLLLTNLIRTSRFHSTQGTPLSSYLRCDRLIEQLLANLQPRRR